MDRIIKLIEPKSIAVIGASSDKNKIGYQIFDNILSDGFKGPLYPINKKRETILGIKSEESIGNIADNVDLAIIVIPSPYVLGVVKECIEKRVSSIIIISSGFSETGTEGASIQKEIVDLCNKANVALLGPNCLGLINTSLNLNASFAATMPTSGNVGFISQSGAMVSALIDWSRENNVGLSKVLSIGNMAQIHESDLLEYLYHDSSTDIILLYLETLVADRKLTKLLSDNATKKPTIVLFGGKTKSGNTAAISHTGAIVSSYKAIETYFKQSGVILAEGLDDFFFTTKLMSMNQKITGDNIAIITNAGGPSIIACDSLDKNQLSLSKLSLQTMNSLKSDLGYSSTSMNPIDLLGDATSKEYKSAIHTVLNDKSVDGMLILITQQSSTDTMDIAREISRLHSTKPVVPVFLGSSFSEENHLLSKKQIASFSYPEEAVSALRHLVDLNSPKDNLIESETKSEIFNVDGKFESLRKFNLPALEYISCVNEKDLDNIALKVGFPLVAKTADPTIIHKSEARGVILNIENSFQLEKAFRELGQNIVVGRMLSGHEIFIGVKKDPNIGTIIAFGTGGIYSEIYDDFAYRVSPISVNSAKKMINETKIGKILNGARGQKSYDTDKLAQIIVNTALLADSFGNITEIDFNPLIADANGYFIVDARIILDKEF